MSTYKTLITPYVELLRNLLNKKTHWFANAVTFKDGKIRNYWHFWQDGVYISNPRIQFKDEVSSSYYSNPKYNGWSKHSVTSYRTDPIKTLTFKRMPNKWIPEFEFEIK